VETGGCRGPGGQDGLPPVRLREISDHGLNLASRDVRAEELGAGFQPDTLGESADDHRVEAQRIDEACHNGEVALGSSPATAIAVRPDPLVGLAPSSRS
jgi:hypothetical protein